MWSDTLLFFHAASGVNEEGEVVGVEQMAVSGNGNAKLKKVSATVFSM